jgi:hypothetical protein
METTMAKSKKLKTVSTKIVPDQLKAKDLSVYIHFGSTHYGVYGDNTARLWHDSKEKHEKTDKAVVYMSKSSTQLTVADEDMASDFLDTPFRIGAMVAKVDEHGSIREKEESIALADEWNIPKKLRYRREAQVYQEENYRIFQWVNCDYAIVLCPTDKNILSFVAEQPEIPDNVYIVGVKPSDDKKTWVDLLAHIVDGETHLSCDTETYDVDEPCGPGGLIPWMGRIRCLQIYAPNKDEVAIFDMGARHEFEGYSEDWPLLLQEALRDRKLIWHNALFDLGFLHYQWGVDLWYNKIFCTQVMSQNMWAGVKFIPHGLGALAGRSGLEIDKGLQTSDFGMPLTNGQWVYGAEDTKVTWGCYRYMVDAFRHSDWPTNIKFANLDCDYLHVAHEIRTTGMFVNEFKLEQARVQTVYYLLQQEEKWFQASGFRANVHYTKLVPWLEERGHNVLIDDPKKKGKKKKSADKSVLKEAAKTDPAVGLLLDCRAANKLLEFILSLQGMAKVHDGKAVCGLRALASQGLGRTSSSSLVRGKGIPTTANLQNIPTKNFDYPMLPNLRACFEAPEGYTYVGVDLSAAHLRFAAYFSGCDNIIKMMQPGEDVHCFNASLIVKGVEGDDHPLADYKRFVTIKSTEDDDPDLDAIIDQTVPEGWTWKELQDLAKHYRNIAKTAIYTAINMGGANRLKGGLKSNAGIIVTEEEAKAIMAALWEGIPEIKSYVYAETNRSLNYDFNFRGPNYVIYGATEDDDEWDDFEDSDEDDDGSANKVQGYAYMQAPYGGRCRYLPKYKNKFYKDRAPQPKANDVASFLWMSREADLMKRAHIRFLREYILPNKLMGKVWLANNVHDESVVIAKDEYALEAAETIGRLMEEEWRKICPVVAGVEGEPIKWCGRGWNDIH